jgi:hypothetical protein
MRIHELNIVFFCLVLLAGPARALPARTPVFLHFFDWFKSESWQEAKFVDSLNWGSIGVSGADRSSEDFYFKQFRYIHSLGIDALAWEYHPNIGAGPTLPPPAALAALKRSGLKIAPFYDLEISLKVKNHESKVPTLSSANGIHPNAEMSEHINGEMRQFFARVPRNLLAKDKQGRLVVFVFGYAFDDSNPDPRLWDQFANALVAGASASAGSPPTFYWTAANSVFAAHLFSHHRDHFVPFQFVLDTPQSQYGHDAVTWNFGFDNLGVQHTYKMQRVVRLDLRYVQEMGWLAGATDPSLVFLYSWNEPFEGSLLLPTRQWGDTKARLTKEFIARLRSRRDPPLPKTLLIIDDLDELWTTRKDDWHLKILSDLLLYPMRRFAPQADVRMVREVDEKEIRHHEIIVDLSSRKTARLCDLLLAAMSTRRMMIFDPLRDQGGKLSDAFERGAERLNINREVEIAGTGGKLFARDDVYGAEPCLTCGVKLSAKLGSRSLPLVLTRGDDVLVNAYPGNEEVLRAAFSALYDQPMRKSILYGEAYASQRVEVDAATGKVTYNHLSRWSVNGHWAIPPDIDWFKPPLELAPEHLRFVFGLDE